MKFGDALIPYTPKVRSTLRRPLPNSAGPISEMRRALVLRIVADFDQHSINFHFHFEYNVIGGWIHEAIFF